MDKSSSHITTKPFYLLLLPLFFSVHGYLEYKNVEPAAAAVEVFFIFSLAALVIVLLLWVLFRHWAKAALAAFAILSFNLFFGSVHDWLKEHADGRFISKYVFIVPLSLILLAALFVYLKKSKQPFRRITRYLNLLFVVLLVIDGATLLGEGKKEQPLWVSTNDRMRIVDSTIPRPDIYLILVDEYAGHQELNDLFSYDNSGFEAQLRRRNFRVFGSTSSNYNWTIYSMASMLNMGYLQGMRSNVINNETMYQCSDLIEKNHLQTILQRIGYAWVNHSIFDIAGQPKTGESSLLPSKKSLFTAQTFVRRFAKDLGFHFAGKGKIENILKETLRLNEEVMRRTYQTIATRSAKPKFVYTHLLMPHHPYYYDSTGKVTPEKLWYDEAKLSREAYVSYLKFANKQLLELIDNIKSSAVNMPVILLMSDHGFRQFSEPVDKRYHFMNLNAVLVPDAEQAGFYNGISNVNQFRVLLNHLFKQELPLLPDSSIFLEEQAIPN